MILRRTAALWCDPVRVVETGQSLTIRTVQRRRIVEAVRLFRRHRDACHDEPDPMAAFRINDEHLPVEVEECIERQVARLRHTK